MYFIIKNVVILEVKKYTATLKESWNTFVSEAKNTSFLFHRDFMDYHSDRFKDHSLMVYDEETLIAVFPANIIDNTLYSHQGLTYGGLLLSKKIKLAQVKIVFQELMIFLSERGVNEIFIKQIPDIYCSYPSNELDFLLHSMNADLYRKDVLSAIDLKAKPIEFSKDRKEGVKRGLKHNLKVKEVIDFDAFWNTILIPNLHQKHKTKPVHSLEEITLLKKRFPEQIRQFNVYKDCELVAGTTIFETQHVAHSQYISANADKNTLGSLDVLHSYLINQVFNEKKYFDFGMSHEKDGRINKGLLYWKEGFGARSITQNFYKIKASSYNLLNSVFR